MNDLQVIFDNQARTFAPGTTVRIGRSSDNDVVVDDPTVSRHHAEISWQAAGWVWRNAGQAPTFVNGQQMTGFAVTQDLAVSLASPQGPALSLRAAPPPQPGTVPAAQPAAAAAAGASPATGYAAPAPPGAATGPGTVPGLGTGPGATPPGMGGYQPVPGQAPLAPTADLSSALHILVPVRSWLRSPGLRQGIRLVIIPYALLPLIFLQIFSTSSNLATPGWVYSIFVAPLWLMAFWYIIRPGRVGRTEIMISVGVMIWTVIWLHTVTITINDKLHQPLNLPSALVVGFNEETTKGLPVLIAAMLLLHFRNQKLSPRMWMLMGTIAGLTFGVVEQSIYTPAAIVAVSQAHVNSQAVGAELLFSFRVFVDGFQHAVWAGITGFFVGMAVNYRRRRVLLLLLGLSIAAVLHALNDWTLTVIGVWGGAIVQAVSLFLFLGYTLSAANIERQVRRNPAFRGQSILMDKFSESEDATG